jgi:hypothetical protein
MVERALGMPARILDERASANGLHNCTRTSAWREKSLILERGENQVFVMCCSGFDLRLWQQRLWW